MLVTKLQFIYSSYAENKEMKMSKDNIEHFVSILATSGFNLKKQSLELDLMSTAEEMCAQYLYFHLRG